MRRRKPKTLPPIHPSAAIQAAYQRALDMLIKEMCASVSFWITERYRAAAPAMATDASPAGEMQSEISALGAQWQSKFDRMAPELATYFATAVAERTELALKSILRRGGMTVQFQLSQAQRDALDAIVHENVSLIRSISSQYLAQVEGDVMRAVTTGRDIGGLTEALVNRYGVTRRRAALIARDQNNKATGSLTRIKYVDAGITEAIWLHSAGGRQPRPTHKANSGKRFNLAEGWFDPDVGEKIQPGQLINCRCVCKPIIPALDDGRYERPA